ncbi:GNAT family N-acetyltransferase [Agromyces aurantiacus]|uniref:GNAT family N-acetyltransferase n=1 Tax=Agromyces aurantiacus TaxID=165814 RepID=A0ABV9R2Q3_9MICO|nr:GNAT family N-acetyltransferase [Agromyces aurantiacus]MBM7506093.1 RimJ/RimL family protein N-acetyltransferase [Agromyces aurantiacus]
MPPADVGGIRLSGGMPDVALRPWSDGDLDLLRRANAPELMEQLGGPESDAKVVDRHERYLRGRRDGSSWMSAIVTPEHPEGVGTIGFWPHEHHGRPAFEAGWTVLAEHQGRGIAGAALGLLVDEARRVDPARALLAFPRVSNAPSNAICRRAGFRLEGVEEFEYPTGTWLPSNVWVLPPEHGSTA